MGLLNKKNIAMAKKFADKNKDKIASGVKKATDTIDEKTGGKHTDRLKKIDDAARKYAGVEATAATHDGRAATSADTAPDGTATIDTATTDTTSTDTATATRTATGTAPTDTTSTDTTSTDTTSTDTTSTGTTTDSV